VAGGTQEFWLYSLCKSDLFQQGQWGEIFCCKLRCTLYNAGESGLGKSTLMNSMFLADIYSAEYPGPSHRIKKTVQVETTKVLLKENGVNLTLTVVDTPGFGDAVDNSNWLVDPLTELHNLTCIY